MWSGREGPSVHHEGRGGRETRSSDMHRHSYSLLRYGQTVYTGGAAHSRPQAEAEEMKKDLETIMSSIPWQGV